MIYVDPLQDYAHDQIKPAARKFGTLWCHMIADTPEELHAMASAIGLRVEWHQNDVGPNEAVTHYDLTPPKRALALRRGAIEISREEMGRKTIAMRGAARAKVGWERAQ